MSWQLGALGVLTLALGAGVWWYERTRPDARMVALVSCLAALGALGRIAFAALPNVKPTTDIVLLSGYALGPAPGFMVGALAGLASNFFFGQGPWTPWQMAGWGATGVIGAWLAIALGGGERRVGRLPLAVICAVIGFGFTALQDVGDWVTYSDHSSSELAVYVGKGVGFDFVHAAGCVVFALAFGPAFARAISRFARRLEVKWMTPASFAPVTVAVLLAGAAILGPSGAGRAQAAPGLQATVAYLKSAQNTDGGFGSAPGQPSAQMYAGWAALGLASAGVNPSSVSHGGQSVISYLVARAGSDSDPGSVERTILALRASGVGVASVGGHDLLSTLQADIGSDGSVSNQVNLTSFAVMALRAAAVAVPSQTLSWLAAQEDSDGGFNYATAGGPSDVDDTGAALEALAGAPGARAAGDRTRAEAFIERHQNADGGFPSMPRQQSNAQSTAWAVQGLLAAGATGQPVDRALSYLGSLIATDGHVRYAAGSDQTPVWVTAQALMALERKPLPLFPASPGAGSAPPARPLAGHTESRAHASHHRQPAVRGAGISSLASRVIGDEVLGEAIMLAPIGLG